MKCCDSIHQCSSCPTRPAAVAPIKLTRSRTCEELGVCQSKPTPCSQCAPIKAKAAPVRRAPMDDELQLSNWDRFWFWGTVSVAGVCTLVVIVGGVGWAYGKYMA